MKSIKFDALSLQFFRIFFGLVLLFDVCWTFCLPYSRLFESEHGVWGTYFLEKYIAAYQPNNPLYALITTNFQFKAYLALVMLLIAVYIAGYFPKIISLLITFLLGALFAKYNILLSGWQQYMLCVLFLSSFIIEQRAEKNAKDHFLYEYVLLFQIGFIYFYNAVSKTGPNWLDGSAIEMCLRYYPLTTPFGNSLLAFPFVLKLLTYGSLVFEVFIIVLFLFFFSNRRVRIFAGISIVLFHLGIQTTMQVGHFYLMAISISLLVLPLDTLLTGKIFHHPGFRVKRRTPLLVRNSKVHAFIAGFFIYCIVMSNVYLHVQQHCRRNNTDFTETVLYKLYPNDINYVPFFYQFWHFFAPNPPLKTGIISFVGITKTDSVPLLIYDGRQVAHTSYSGINKYLAVYMALKDYNIKDKLFIESSLREQFKAWNANPANVRLSSFNLYEFYGVRYMDRLPADTLMGAGVRKKLKLNFELHYKD